MYERKCTSLWVLAMIFSLVFPGNLLKAQSSTSLSITEIHTLTETMINYSPDSVLVLLDIAADKISQVKDEDLASAYWAENNLRRAEYWLIGDTEKAQFYLKKAISYYRIHGSDQKLALIYCLKAQITEIESPRPLDAVRDALPYFDTALTYATVESKPYLMAFIHYERAVTLQQAEMWQESLEEVFLSLSYAEQSKDSLSMATSSYLMGITYDHFGFSRQAERYMAKAIGYGKGMFRIYGVIHTYANILRENNKSDLAIQNYKLALEMCSEKNQNDRIILIHTSIGQLQLAAGNFEEAEKAFYMIREILEGSNPEAPSTALFFAQIYNYQGNDDTTLAILNDFGKMYSNDRLNYSQIDVFKGVADLYFKLGRTKESSVFYQTWGELKDSLQNHTNRQQLSELERLYFNERAKNAEITEKNKVLQESRESQATMGILFIGLLLLAGGITYYIRMKGLKENEKLKVALKNKQLKQFMEVQENERQRLARELHDGIGQSLAALKLQLQFGNVTDDLPVVIEEVDTLCKEVRTLSHQMMPLVLSQNGLEDAIRQLLISSFAKVDVETDILAIGLNTRLPENVEVHLYRITQELISNILKHSNADKVGVQLLLRGDMIILIVEDNGKGFSKGEKFEGIGISNIYSRVETLSGAVRIQSSEEEGTYVHIEVPITSNITRKTA